MQQTELLKPLYLYTRAILQLSVCVAYNRYGF